MGKEFNVEAIISLEDRQTLYKILYVGVSAYNRLINENRDLVVSKAFGEIKTRLLSFVVKRQFDKDLFPLDFPYKADFEKVNHFGNVALFIKNDKAKIHINKTSKARKLYNSNKPSNYMLKEAKINSKYTNEIKFFTDKDDEVGVKEDSRVFMILGYGLKAEVIDHLDFLIPESNMRECLDVFDALDEYNKYIMDDIEEEEIESEIVALKDEALKFVNNFGR